MGKEVYKSQEFFISDINNNNLLNVKIPYYQRPYSWTKKEVKELIEDIFKEKKEYLIGNITAKVKELGILDEVDIIDGQQRLTTIMLISLSLLLMYWCETGKREEEIYGFIYKGGKGKKATKNDTLWLKSGGLDQEPLKKLGSIIFNKVNCKEGLKEDFSSVCKKIAKEVDESQEGNITRMFLKICNIFNTKFKNKKNRKTDIIKFFSKYAGNKSIIKFILIEAKISDSDSIKIFNNINTKQKPLDAIDNIKNYIFSKIEDKNNIKMCFEYWGNIYKKVYNVSDYLLTYLRANNCMWDSSLTLHRFSERYNTDLKVIKFIKDFYEKQKFYELFKEKINRNEKNICNSIDNPNQNMAKVSMDIYRVGGYKFIRPILFKIFVEKKKYEEIFDLVMFCFISKTLGLLKISKLQETMKKISKSGLSNIRKIIKKTINSEGITKNDIFDKLCRYTVDAYKKNRKMCKYLLAIYQAQGDASHIDILLESAKNNTVQIDHKVSQNGDNEDFGFIYDKNKDVFIFADNNDYNMGNRVKTEDFLKQRLNNIGNLEYMTRTKNIQKSNKAQLSKIENVLSQTEKFSAKNVNNWKTIQKRQKVICEYLCEAITKNFY